MLRYAKSTVSLRASAKEYAVCKNNALLKFLYRIATFIESCQPLLLFQLAFGLYLRRFGLVLLGGVAFDEPEWELDPTLCMWHLGT
jgi:hypothetical protein